jgi:HEAT repeat protein
VLKTIESGSPKEKVAALKQLRLEAANKRLGEHKKRTIELCAQLMEDKDSELGSEACDVLSWLDADAVPVLVKALQSKEPITQSNAALALSSIASRNREQVDRMEPAIGHLARLLHGEANSARHNAFYAISEMGPRAFPHMIEALDAEEPFVWVMMRGFVRHPEAAIPALCEALRKGDVPTRRNAAFVLFHISWRARKALPVLERQALGPLTEAINDKDQLVRSQAIETLGRMEERAKPALDKIIAALEQPDPPFAAIANAAAQIGPQVKHLDALFDGAQRMHDKATSTNDRESSTGRFGRAISAVGEKGLDRIIRALGDRREAVRQTALYALFELGPEAAPAVPAVIEMLNKEPLAPQVLGAIGPKAKAAVPHLIRHLEKDDWANPRSVRVIMHHSPSADALAAIGPAALPALLDGLKHENDLVKAGCMVALARMDAKADVPLSAIQPLTHDNNPIVRTHAMRALVRHGLPREQLMPILQHMEKDTHPGVAAAAHQALAELRRPKD